MFLYPSTAFNLQAVSVRAKYIFGLKCDCIDIIIVYIKNFETEPPLRHFTDKTTEATISKFGSGVLYSIRMKVGIIKSVLIKAFI